MNTEEEVWNFVHGDPKEIDPDLLLDASMLARIRAEQYYRWMACPRLFMSRDINAMTAEAIAEQRRKKLKEQTIKEFKEGTNVRRKAEEEED